MARAIIRSLLPRAVPFAFTRRTGFPDRLAAAGFGEWNDLAKLHEVRDLLASVLGGERVLVGCEGFNSVGSR